jgi:amino acid transporter
MTTGAGAVQNTEHTDRPSGSAGAEAEPTLQSSLSAGRLILMVIAAAAPMAAVIGIVPVAFAAGNGPGVPATFIIVTVVLGLFSVGYSAMSRRIVSTGAFYSYIARGLGGVPGLGAAFVAVVSYTVFVSGAVAYFAVFTESAIAQLTGWDGTSWIWYALIGAVLIGALGYRRIDLSSKIIAVLLSVEFFILLALTVSIVVHLRPAAFPLQSFSVHSIGSGAPGIAIMLAFTCFIGFESAALYSEESRDPQRSVARATYGSVFIIGGFYLLISWVTVGAVGTDRIADVATQNTGTMYFDLTARYLAPWVSDIMAVAMATSLFATALSIHNVASRYLFALGRQRCLPGGLGRAHQKHGSPHVSSMVVTTSTCVIVIVSAVAHIAPLVGLGTVTVGFGTVGIIALQCLTSLAVIGYFRRHRSASTSLWATTIAPALAFVGLTVAVVLATTKFELLSGATNTAVNALPTALLVVFVIGGGYALWLKSQRPQRYQEISRQLVSEPEE